MEIFLPGSRRLAFAALLLAGSGAMPAADLRVASPSGILGITFTLDPDGAPLLSVDYRGRPLVLPSRLGLPAHLAAPLSLSASRTEIHDAVWENPRGARRRAPGRYHALSVDLRSRAGDTVGPPFAPTTKGPPSAPDPPHARPSTSPPGRAAPNFVFRRTPARRGQPPPPATPLACFRSHQPADRRV